MESALSDLKKICDEVKESLDPIILASIEALIDKTYTALKDEKEDARALLEETLLRGVELVQKSKTAQDTLHNLTMVAQEAGGDVLPCIPASGEEEDSGSECEEGEVVCTTVLALDPALDAAISHTQSPVIRLKVEPPEPGAGLGRPGPQVRLSRSLERLDEASKVISHNKLKVNKVLKSVNSSNPFVQRVSTATSTGLPKYMFTPRAGQLKPASTVFKASTVSSVQNKSSPSKAKLESVAVPGDEAGQENGTDTGVTPAPAPPCPAKPAKQDPPNTVVSKYTHHWTVAHFSKKMKMGNGKSIDSMFFSIIVLGKKTDWSLMLYPNGDKEKVAGYVSLYLTCRNRKGLAMSLEFKFTLLDSEGKSATAPTKSGSITAQMLATNSSWGWESFVKQEELVTNSLLPNDRLTICCDITLKCSPSTAYKEITVEDNRDIDQLVNFVGELRQQEEAVRGKKKAKKGKQKKLEKEVEEKVVRVETDQRAGNPPLVKPARREIPVVKTNIEITKVKTSEMEVEPSGDAKENDFQVVTRKKVRKNSQSSSTNSKASISPKIKKNDPKLKAGKATKVVPCDKTFPGPISPPSKLITSPQQVYSVQPSKAKFQDTPVRDVTLQVSSLRLDTKESLSELLSTKSLLEENISRLSELVLKKTAAIDQIAQDRTAKLKGISAMQEDLKDKRVKLEEKTEEQKRMLRETEAELEEVELQLKKGGEKAARMSNYLDMNLLDAERDLSRLGKEKDSLMERLGAVEDKLRGNRQKEKLLNIHNQIKRLQTNLECPICLETAYNPIYQCREGHLVCSSCVQRVARCAMCRQDGPVTIRNRYAENDSLELSGLLCERREIMAKLSSNTAAPQPAN